LHRSEVGEGRVDGAKGPVSGLAESDTTLVGLVKFEENIPDFFDMGLDFLGMQHGVSSGSIDHLLLA